jgi:hypothetical protein
VKTTQQEKGITFMGSQPFQTSFQTFATDFGITGILDASITGLTVLDPTEGNEPTLLLEPDDPFAVQVDWQLSGAALCSLGGTWQVALYIDDIDGVGLTHGQLGSTTLVPVVGCQSNYSVTFSIAANSVSDGVYQLVVTINHSPQGGPATSLTENVGFAQSAPIKVTTTVAESGSPD